MNQTATVVSVSVHNTNSDWRIVTVRDQTGERRLICFSPQADALRPGEPLPEGHSIEPPKFEGALPSLRLPRPKGSGAAAAWRNTKEGAEFELQSRIRWQQVEQERMDRRTALMQAVALGGSLDDVLASAHVFYAWLRETAGTRLSEAPGASPPPPRAQHPTPTVETAPEGAQGSERANDTGLSRAGGAGGVDAGGQGTGSGSACPSCGAEWGPRRTSSGKRLCINGHVEKR